MKKYLKYIVIAAVILAAIIVYVQIRKKANRPEWRSENPSVGTIREVVTATGSINPYILVEVGTEVSGKIEKIYKDFNDRVRNGDLLARLDTEILQTNLESAKAEVSKAKISENKARLDYQNYQDLVAKGYAPAYDLQQAEYTYRQAQQSLANANLTLQRAQKNLANASITSPIDGVVVSREVSEGQTVAASMNAPTLFTIANNLDLMEITANVDEADIGRIEVGMPVEFSVDAHAGEQFLGVVKQIRLKSTTEQNVVSYSVIINADNPEHKLLPGMTTNVTIIVQNKENVLRIPETATRFTPSKEVWELFGLKWEEDFISNARKKAMESLFANREAPARGNGADGNAAGGRPSRRGFDPSKMPSRAALGGGMNGADGRSSNAMIWVLKDKVPELIMVRTGVSDGAYQEVLSELDKDLQIITGVNYKDAAQATKNSALQQGRMGPRF